MNRPTAIPRKIAKNGSTTRRRVRAGCGQARGILALLVVVVMVAPGRSIPRQRKGPGDRERPLPPRAGGSPWLRPRLVALVGRRDVGERRQEGHVVLVHSVGERVVGCVVEVRRERGPAGQRPQL